LLRRLVDRAGYQSLVTVDQLIFSAIAFVVQAAAIPVATDAEYGIFTLVAMVQTGQWYVSRAVTSEPMLVSRTAASKDPKALRPPAATALALGLVIGLCSLIVALFLDGTARDLLLVQAVASPFLGVLDHARYVGYGKQRPLLSLVLDGGWLVIFAAAAATMALVDHLDVTRTYVLWAVTGILATLAAVVTTGAPFSLGSVVGWIKEQRKLIPGFLIDALYLAAGIYATFGMAIWATGLDGYGLLRKAMTPITAMTVLFVGIGNALLAHLAGRSAKDVVRAPAIVSLLAAGVCAVGMLIVVVLPADLMSSLLKADWATLEPVVLILLVYALLLASGQTAMVAAKASGRAWVGPRVRTIQLVCELSLIALLGTRFGVIGAASGMALAWAIGAAIAWIGLTRHARADNEKAAAATAE
jgi:O-antigen/teichoic acid export membrane protein